MMLGRRTDQLLRRQNRHAQSLSDDPRQRLDEAVRFLKSMLALVPDDPGMLTAAAEAVERCTATITGQISAGIHREDVSA